MITRAKIDTDKFIAGETGAESGAVVTFSGVVRSRSGDRTVRGIFYDCYDELANTEINRIADELIADGKANDVRVVHRVGDVPAGETSLFVLVRSTHRREALDAVARIVEEIKHRVPIWKKEHYADETARWL